MKFYQKLDGATHVSAREYDIAADTAICDGQLVKLADGLVVAAAANETGALLGVAAENHSGVADALDPRADGTKIMVLDDPEVVLQCKAPEVTASGGTATTLKAATLAADFANGDFTGGWVKLIAKGAESTNTDAPGTQRRITGFAAAVTTEGSEADATFTLTSGGVPCAGDVYAVFPPIGFAKGNLDSGKSGLVLTATASLPLRVIGSDRGFGKINLMIKKHAFAVDA